MSLVHKFRLAQISDLHLSAVAEHKNILDGGEGVGIRGVADDILKRIIYKKNITYKKTKDLFYPSTYKSDVAIALVRDVHRHLATIDVLIVTGDLATTGQDIDLRIARKYFEGSIPSAIAIDENNPIPSLLDNPDDVILTLPGNHDRYDGVTLRPGGYKYENYFGQNWDFDRGHAESFNATRTKKSLKFSILMKEGVALVVICCDLTLDYTQSATNLFGSIGQGKVTADVLNDLEELTSAFESKTSGDRKYVVMWALHFPPEHPGANEYLRLIDGCKIIDLANRLNVRMIIAGHLHEAEKYTPTMGAVDVFCCGASSGYGVQDVNSYNIFELDISEDGDIKKCQAMNRIYNKVTGNFKARYLKRR